MTVNNKSQMSQFTFDCSLEATHIAFPSIYNKQIFSETIWPSELKCDIITSLGQDG